MASYSFWLSVTLFTTLSQLYSLRPVALPFWVALLLARRGELSGPGLQPRWLCRVRFPPVSDHACSAVRHETPVRLFDMPFPTSALWLIHVSDLTAFSNCSGKLVA